MDRACVASDAEALRRLLDEGVKATSALLYRAIRPGGLAAVKLLLDRGADPNPCNPYHCPLNFAITSGDTRMVVALLEHGANVNPRCSFTPLIQASHFHPDMVRILLEAGAEVNHGFPGGCTALGFAAQANQDESVRLLLDAGAKVGFMEAVLMGDVAEARSLQEQADPAAWFGSRPPLIQAALAGRLESVKLLLELGFDVDVTDTMAQTALGAAAALGRLDLVQFLLERGAEPNLGGHPRPLLQSVEEDRRDLVEILLEGGARPGSQERIAARRDHPDILPLLEAHGGRIDLPEAVRFGDHEVALQILAQGGMAEWNRYSYDLLAEAARRGDNRMLELLIQHGADPRASRDRWTVLMCATDHPSTVQFLLDHGARINARKPNGETALHYAAQQGSVETVRLLLARGAKTETACDLLKFTPIFRAVNHGHTECVRLLIEAGVRLNRRDYERKTVLQIAREKGYEEIVAILVQAGARE